MLNAVIKTKSESVDAHTSAIDSFDGRLSYAELATAIDATVKTLSTTTGPIACLLPASADYVVLLLAAMKLERPIMPLSPDLPKARLVDVFRIAMPGVLVSDRANHDLPDDMQPTMATGSAASGSLQVHSASAVSPFVASGDCAYLLTTSGSTGTPKMIAGSRAGLEHFMSWEASQVDAPLRGSLLAPPVFDVSLRDILLPLCVGGCVHIPSPGIVLDGAALFDWLREQRITHVHIVPTLLRTVLDHVENVSSGELPNLNVVASAGEPLFHDDVIRVRTLFGADVSVWNLYGPSETSLAKCCFAIPDDVPEISPLPVGFALPETEVVAVSQDGVVLPAGEEGQLAIRTQYPSLGYVVDGEIRALPQVADGYFPTGDRGALDDNGQVLIRGRMDRQIKIRGQRVEPGDIEVALRNLSTVKDAAIVFDATLPGGGALIAYVVTQDQQALSIDQLRIALAEWLPEYMLPGHLIAMQALPRTASGKIASRELPPINRQRPQLATPFVAPRSGVEQQIADIWSAALQLSSVGVNDRFFDLGGTSLLAQSVVQKIGGVLGQVVPVVQFFERPTIASFVSALNADTEQEITPQQHERASNADDREIAIVGVAGSFPDAANVDAFWQHLLDGDDCISKFDIDALDPKVDPETASQKNYVAARGLMPDVDAFDARHFGITPREAEIMDPQQRVFLQTAWHAFEDAALDPQRYPGSVGVYAGTGDNTYLWNYVLQDREALAAIGEHQVHLSNERDYLATRVAYKLDLRGPAINVSTGCSTALVAVCQAVDALRAGHCDTALAGGSFVPAPHVAGHLYQEGGFGSSDGHCRPFDRAASGTVFSSGSAAVVLKRRVDAEADGDRIYGVIKGIGLNNDGGDKMSFMAPSSRGQSDVIRRAVTDAGVNPADINCVEAHGTATPIGDPIEVSALSAALGKPAAGERWLGSVKSNIGHVDAAAGVAGLIKVAKTMHTGLLPGTVHFESANEALDLEAGGFSVSAGTVAWRDSVETLLAGVSSFGVGGTNAHVVVESVAPVVSDNKSRRDAELLLLSAQDADRLTAVADSVREFVAESDAELADVAYSLERGRVRQNCRAAIVATPANLQSVLGEYVSAAVATMPHPAPSAAFVFPGQGSQHIGMGKGLYQQSAVFREVFDQGADALLEPLGVDLRTLLFESESNNEEAIGTLTQTRITQPALYVLQVALARHWQAWGVQPELVMGHSIGEFAAATIAGVMDFATGLTLVEARGRLIQDQPSGSMLSVRASAELVAPYLSGNLSIAAVNAAELCAVSGPHDEIVALEDTLAKADIAARSVVTSHAFHSSMMEPARIAFENVVASVDLHAPKLPYISTMTGQAITTEEATSPSYWGKHLRNPVLFSAAIEAAWEGGSPLLLEVGPRTVATTLARQHCSDPVMQRAVNSLAGNAEPDAEWQDMLRAAGALWTHGLELDWATFYDREQRNVVSTPGYPFRKTRYWMGTTYENDLGEVATVDDPLHAELCEMVAKGAGFQPGAGDLNRSFIDLGLDSLFLTQFGISLQSRFDVQVSLRQLVEQVSSIKKLADTLREQGASTNVEKLMLKRPLHLPPADGAFVGRDSEGTLGWFIEDPDEPGQFLKLEAA